MQTGKIYTGIIQKKEDAKFTLKTLSGLVEIDQKKVIKIQPVMLDRIEVYTPEEIYLQERKQYDLTKPADNYKLAEYCLEVLRLYDKAKEHFKAAALDPNYQSKAKEKISLIIGLLMKKIVNEVELALKKKDAQKARELLTEKLKQDPEFLRDPVTSQIIKELESKITALEKKIASILEAEKRKEVISKWYKSINEHLKKIAQNRQSSYLDVTRAVLDALPRQIKTEIANELKLDEAEVDKIWRDRKLEESTKAIISYGNGSWVVAPRPQPPTDVNEFIEYQQRMRRIEEAKREAAQAGKLLTPEAWWQSAPIAQKTNWLKAFFAERRMKVIEKVSRPCPQCRGNGVISKGKDKFGLCLYCQGATIEIIIKYY